MTLPPAPLGPAARLPRASPHAGRPQGEHQRQLLRHLVASNPGLHVLRAAALLGLNWNTCLYHVRRLEARQEILLRKVGGRLCLFDRREGAVAPQLAPLLLRQGRNAEIARAVLANPGLNQKGLAAAVGMAPSVVHRRLLQFEGAGLVQRVARSRSVAVYATNTLQDAGLPSGLVPAAPAAGPFQAPATGAGSHTGLPAHGPAWAAAGTA